MITECTCGGRVILQTSEDHGLFIKKQYFRYACGTCGKKTSAYDNAHDAFKEWEALNTKILKLEIPILSPEETKECREYNKRLHHPRNIKITSEAQNIINDLRSVAEWFKEHGRNTNTAVISICERAADYLEKHAEREDHE